MAIRLTIQEDRPKLKVGQGSAIPLRASSGYPIYENNYDDLRNKPSINGVTLSGDKTTEDLGIEAGVTSWNGQTGDVVYTPPEAPVQSVNGKTGAVVLNASDVGALPSSTAIPTKTSDLTNDSGYITGINSSDVASALGYTPYNATNPSGYVNATQAANAAPVQSVNGQTGTVSLNIPTKTSDLTNDSGYITSAPVQSVNSKTGAVVLSASDVGALPDDTEFSIAYSENSIGSALVGEAVTTEPNYTPSGDVVMDYEIKDNKLYIYGFHFNGSGVKFAIEKEQ